MVDVVWAQKRQFVDRSTGVVVDGGLRLLIGDEE